MRRVVVIGGGAAGCFASIEIRRLHPDWEVTLLEAGPRLLAKVAVTGGGRCNLTNSFDGVEDLRKVYPRGAQLMKRALRVFSPQDTMRWFEAEGVALVVQSDHCVFPASQDAMQIVRTLERALRRSGVRIVTDARVTNIETGYTVRTEQAEYPADTVLVTTGGSPKAAGLGFLSPLGLETVEPVPSLFTLRVDDPGLRGLMGTLAEVTLSLPGTPFRSEGTLLLTDWGISGPATLRLSSYAARYLAEKQYRGVIVQIDWLCGERAEEVLADLVAGNPRKALSSVRPAGITARLWEHLLGRAGLREGIRCAEVGSRGLARLAETLRSDQYPLSGRVHFKEEFVTCGGVSLSEITLSTLEAKRCPGLFFAGEVLDVDAVTGGFNLQAAWSMGTVAARSIK